MAGLTIPIEGDITPLLATFAKIPGRTQKELDAIARVTEREITSGAISKAFAELPNVAGKSAKKAAAMVSKEMDKMSAETRARLGEMKQGFGAVFGSGLINDIGDVGAAFGPVGLAAMGLGIAITGTAAAAAGLAYAAVEVGSALYAAAASTGALKDEQGTLQLTLDSLYRTIGEDYVPASERALDSTSALVLASQDLYRATHDSMVGLQEWSGASDTAVHAGVMLATNQGLVSTAFGIAAEKLWLYLDPLKKYNDEVKGINASERARLDAVERARKMKEYTPSGPSQKDAEKPIKTIRKHTAAIAEKSKAEVKAFDLSSIMFADEADNDRALSAQIARNSDDIAEVQQKKIDDAVALKDAQLSTMNAVASASDSLTSLIISNAQDGSDAQKSAALAFFRVNQVASATTAAINTYVAITEALKLGPIAGPIAALGIGITGFAQEAAILAAPQPFHDGGIVGQSSLAPDEQMIRARRGEEVRTRQQQRNDRPMVVQVQQVYQHRAFNAFVADNVAQPTGPLARAIAGASPRRIGHRSYK